MKTILSSIFFVLFLMPSFLKAQKPSEFLPEKHGKWTYYNNIKRPGAEVVAYNKNLASMAEWFHQNVPMLTNPKGFDLLATSFGIWDDEYKKNACNYGLRSEMNFDFQLFLSDLARGGKWVVEPPHYSFYINNTEAGHGTNFHESGWDYSKDPASAEVPLGKVTSLINGLFQIFPLEREIVPGVSLYGDGNLIVFNPDRPDFWLPVTMKEIADMYLEYYTLKKDEFLLPYLRKEIDEMPEDELYSPAFSGHDERVVLRFNGKGEGLQIMRFNPEYWDCSLPPSAIQLMTFYYPKYSQEQKGEHFTNNGYPHYSSLLMNSIKLEKLVGLINTQK